MESKPPCGCATVQATFQEMAMGMLKSSQDSTLSKLLIGGLLAAVKDWLKSSMDARDVHMSTQILQVSS